MKKFRELDLCKLDGSPSTNEECCLVLQKKACSLLFSKTRSFFESEDFAQRAFEKVCKLVFPDDPRQKWQNFQKLSNWFVKVALNLWLDERRKKTPTLSPLTGHEESRSKERESRSKETRKIGMWREALEVAMPKLSPHRRAAIDMRREGKTYEEIGKKLGLPNVRKLVQETLVLIRKITARQLQDNVAYE